MKAKRMNLAVADGRQRDERHVKAVEKRPTFDLNIAERANGDCNGKQGSNEGESF
jgi:hypothetical protein